MVLTVIFLKKRALFIAGQLLSSCPTVDGPTMRAGFLFRSVPCLSREVRVPLYTFLHARACVHMCICIRIHIYVYTHVYIYVHINAAYACIRILIFYLHMYACVFICIHISVFRICTDDCTQPKHLYHNWARFLHIRTFILTMGILFAWVVAYVVHVSLRSPIHYYISAFDCLWIVLLTLFIHSLLPSVM